jgi:hypothetical protein
MRLFLYGGLGNQLFKIAAACKFLESGLISRIIIDKSWYEYKSANLHSENADYQLGGLIDQVNFFETKFSSRRQYHFVSSRISELTEFQARVLRVYQYSGEFVTPQFRPKFLIGNFEDISFLPSSKLMFSIFQKLYLDSEWISQVSNRIAIEDPIIIHIRLGDYKKFPSIYGILDQSYYVKAITLLRSKSCSGPLWLMSDEPLLAIEMFKNKVRFDEVISPSTQVNPAQFLAGISFSKNFILANSTYSWWAAWLASQRTSETNVVMPSRFQADENNINRLKIPEWNIIEV